MAPCSRTAPKPPCQSAVPCLGLPTGSKQPHATAVELLPGHGSGELSLAMSFGGRTQKGSFSVGLGAFTASCATKVPLQPLHQAKAVFSKPTERFSAAKAAFPSELSSSPSLWRSSAWPAPRSCPSRSSDQDGPAPREPRGCRRSPAASQLTRCRAG